MIEICWPGYEAVREFLMGECGTNFSNFYLAKEKRICYSWACERSGVALVMKLAAERSRSQLCSQGEESCFAPSDQAVIPCWRIM
jgi:hypothetical protein